MQGEAVVASTGQDVGPLALLSRQPDEHKVALFDFWGYTLTLLSYSKKKSLYDCEEVALSSARKHTVFK
jgi:hypothetical protein